MATAPDPPPPYPGVNTYTASGAEPPKFSPDQQYLPRQQFSQDPYPTEQQYSYSGQQCPYPNQQYPSRQQCPYPDQQYSSRQQYPSPRQQISSDARDAGFAPYGPQPMPVLPANFVPYGLQPMPMLPADFTSCEPGLMPMPNLPACFPANDMELKGDVTTMSTPGLTNFTDKSVKAMFIKKVYVLLSLQLLCFLVVIAVFIFVKNTEMFLRRYIYLYYVSYLIFFGIFIVLSCFENLRRQYPANMIAFSIFTLSMSYILGAFSRMYHCPVPIFAIGICFCACLGVSVFSSHSKFDFTTCGGVLFIMLFELILVLIFVIFTHFEVMIAVYIGFVTLLFTLYLAYSTHMLIEGKRHKISPEEHIFGAIQIYLNITFILMFLVTCCGFLGKK